MPKRSGIDSARQPAELVCGRPVDDFELCEGVWDVAAASRLLQELLAEIEWQQHRLRIFGREVLAPRLSAWYGDADAVYTYSGLQLQPLRWTPLLRRIRDKVEAVADTGFKGIWMKTQAGGPACVSRPARLSRSRFRANRLAGFPAIAPKE